MRRDYRLSPTVVGKKPERRERKEGREREGGAEFTDVVRRCAVLSAVRRKSLESNRYVR